MDNNSYIKTLQRRRRLKYGSFALAITVAVVALVVVINAIFSALAYKNMWYIDMTERDLYTPDDSAMTLIEQFRGSELNITFTFCMPEDMLVNNELVNMVNNLVKRYAKEFDFINVEYVDIVNNPQILDKYQSSSQSKPKTTSVIVSNGNQALLFAIDTFFVSNDGSSSSIYAFRGDYTIASAVLRLSGDSPIAYFVTNHSEDVSGTAIRELFVDAGYDVRDIDLQKEDLDPSAKVIVINNPKYDFWGPDDSVNELKKLSAVLENSGGLMVFMDETVDPTPNLDLFLEDWGIRFENKFIRDYENGTAGSENGRTIFAQYVTEGTGASLTSPLRALPKPPPVVATNCRPITMLFDETTGKFFTDSTRYVSPVLVTAKSAVAYPLDGEGESASGVFNLMTVTVDDRVKDNTSQRAFVLAAGTTAFSDPNYIQGKSYGNRDIIFYTMRSFAKRNVPININPKIFADSSLSLTAAEANRWTVICTVVFPAIVAGVGIFVYTRRRYL